MKYVLPRASQWVSWMEQHFLSQPPSRPCRDLRYQQLCLGWMGTRSRDAERYLECKIEHFWTWDNPRTHTSCRKRDVIGQNHHLRMQVLHKVCPQRRGFNLYGHILCSQSSISIVHLQLHNYDSHNYQKKTSFQRPCILSLALWVAVWMALTKGM